MNALAGAVQPISVILLRKRACRAGDESAQKLLSNLGLIGDLTGVTLDSSDRLKQKRAQIQPTLCLPMLRPQI